MSEALLYTRAWIFDVQCRLCKTKFSLQNPKELEERKNDFCPICHVWPGNLILLKTNRYIEVNRGRVA